MISFIRGWDSRTRTRIHIRIDTVNIRDPARVHAFWLPTLDHVRAEHYDGAPQTTQATLQARNVYKTVSNPSLRSAHHRNIFCGLHDVILRTIRGR